MILRLASKRILLASNNSNASARVALRLAAKRSAAAATVSFRSKTVWASANSSIANGRTTSVGHESNRDSFVGRLVAAPQLALAYDYIDIDDVDDYAFTDSTTPPSSAAPYPPPPPLSSAPPPGSTTTARKTTDGGGGGGGPGGGGRHRCPKVR